MNALRRVHEALRPEGVLLDLMPFEGWIPVETIDEEVGHLDAREFAQDARAAEAALALMVEEGLYEPVRCTRIPTPLRARVHRTAPPFRVRERLVLRRLRAL